MVLLGFEMIFLQHRAEKMWKVDAGKTGIEPTNMWIANTKCQRIEPTNIEAVLRSKAAIMEVEPSKENGDSTD